MHNGSDGKANALLLLDAYKTVNVDRKAQCGPPAETFKRIADLWSIYLGHDVSAVDVGMCMALLKIARESGKHRMDNLRDAIGYLALAADLRGYRRENPD